MEKLIILFIGIPFLGFLISLLIPSRMEKAISFTAFFTTGILVLFGTAFAIWWIALGSPSLNVNEITLYKSGSYTFFIDVFYDKITLVYLMFSSVLAYLIAVYSRYYLHRESGYKRFFNVKLLFITGVNIILLSGNFETLFIGWEILGVSSFLLIGYYRERYLPVRNALKVYSVYRVADIGLLLAMWLMHHLWHQNITFLQLNDAQLVQTHIANHPWVALAISFAIVLAASAKSAQFPFSSWLPRAMEGPTPSSAIFYGSVAVHIGVYLLLRTYPFWSSIEFMKWNVVAMGLITTITASISSKVQTSVKAKIAYSSITQIGIVFIEVALGFHWIALIHMSGNAFLRAYQLLISPSIVTYLIREQFFNFVPKKIKSTTGRRRIIDNSLYVIGLKEWKLDGIMYRYLWNPLKVVGNKVHAVSAKQIIFFSLAIGAVSIGLILNQKHIPSLVAFSITEFFGIVGLLIVLRAFTERKSALSAWLLVILSHFWIALAVGFNEEFSIQDTLFYLSGVIVSGGFGFYFLFKLKNKEKFDLNDFYGHCVEHKWMSFGFLLSALAIAGFPITTTFLGEDLLFTHIQETQVFLAAFVSLNFVVVGITVMRMYTRIFLGPSKKASVASALRDA